MPTEPLIRLVLSLTKSEKKGFRSAYASAVPEYIRLYDLIVKYPEKTGPEIDNLFKEKGYALSNARKTLQLKIGNYLIGANKSPRKTVSDAIFLIQDLIQRGCFEIVIPILGEAKSQCEHLEFIDLHLELLDLEEQLPWRFVSDDIQLQRKELNQKKNEILELDHLQHLFSHAGFNISPGEPKIDLISQIRNRPILTPGEEKLTHEAQLKFLILNRRLARRAQNYRMAIEFAQKIILLLTQRSERVPNVEGRVLHELFILVSLYDENDQPFEKKKTIQRIAEFETNSVKLNNLKISKLVIPQLASAIDTGNKALGNEIIHFHLIQWELLKDSIPPKDCLIILFYVIKFYLITGQEQKLAGWLNEFFESKKLHPKLFKRLFPFVVLMQAISHINREEYALVSSKIQTLKSFTSAQGITLKYFLNSIHLLSELYKKPTYEHKPILQGGFEQLLPLEKDKKESTSFGYFNINDWILSKLKKVSITSILRNRNKQAGNSLFVEQ